MTLDAGREWFGDAWGSVPERRGLDAAGILAASQQGRIHALLLLGTDPQDDFPDHSLAEGALNAAGFTIAIDTFITDSTKRADVFLPVTMWGEKTGSVTNLEGRVQRVGQKVSPDGTPMPDWRIAAELALRLGADFDLETVEEMQDEIARLAPAYAGVDAKLLAGPPMASCSRSPTTVMRSCSARSRSRVTAASWEPILPGVAGEETHASAQGSGVVASSGTGAAAIIEPGLSETALPPADPELEAVEAQADAAAEQGPPPELHRFSGEAPTGDTPRHATRTLSAS